MVHLVNNCQLVLILIPQWPYRDLGHRDQVRTKAAQDPKWKETVADTAHFIQKMDSQFIVPFGFSLLQ